MDSQTINSVLARSARHHQLDTDPRSIKNPSVVFIYRGLFSKDYVLKENEDLNPISGITVPPSGADGFMLEPAEILPLRDEPDYIDAVISAVIGKVKTFAKSQHLDNLTFTMKFPGRDDVFMMENTQMVNGVSVLQDGTTIEMGNPVDGYEIRVAAISSKG